MGGWKLPPKAKIYEALTAVADARVKLTDGETAEVLSSDGTKTYIVEWSADLRQITSNDNASYWQRLHRISDHRCLDDAWKAGFRPNSGAGIIGDSLETDESQVSERLRQSCRERPAEFGCGTRASPDGCFRSRQDI